MKSTACYFFCFLLFLSNFTFAKNHISADGTTISASSKCNVRTGEIVENIGTGAGIGLFIDAAAGLLYTALVVMEGVVIFLVAQLW